MGISTYVKPDESRTSPTCKSTCLWSRRCLVSHKPTCFTSVNDISLKCIQLSRFHTSYSYELLSAQILRCPCNILHHIIMVVANFDTCIGFVVGDGMQICKDPDRPSNSKKYST
jgi:hypothetical protein